MLEIEKDDPIFLMSVAIRLGPDGIHNGRQDGLKYREHSHETEIMVWEHSFLQGFRYVRAAGLVTRPVLCITST